MCMTNYPLHFEKGKLRKGHKACCALRTHFVLSEDLGWSGKTQSQKFRVYEGRQHWEG